MLDIIDTALVVFTVVYNIRLYSYVLSPPSGARGRVDLLGPVNRIVRARLGFWRCRLAIETGLLLSPSSPFVAHGLPLG